MITYTVYESPEPVSDRLDRAEALEFVKEGFSWLAALFTPFWMIANQLWLVLLGFIALAVLLQTGLWAFGINARSAGYALAALQILVGFEADSLKRWTLERNGWQPAGTVNGRNAEDCQRRFFDDWLPRQPMIRPETLSGPGSLGSGAAGKGPLSGPELQSSAATTGPRSGRWRSILSGSS